MLLLFNLQEYINLSPFVMYLQLLENRTKASRGEIEMVETLEELKELNKRKVVVNFDDMLYRYDEQRQTEAEVQENEDEQLIK